MSEERVKELESRYEDVEVSDTFKVEKHGQASAAGDVALTFLDKQFTVLEEYLKLKLKDGITKTVLLSQLKYIYFIVRASVEHALQ